MDKARNVLGGALQLCSLSPLTGFFRDGCCRTGADDRGLHVVCARVTAEFLAHTRSRGNDLSTPHPQEPTGPRPATLARAADRSPVPGPQCAGESVLAAGDGEPRRSCPQSDGRVPGIRTGQAPR